jgi:hypothetical protein
VVRTTIILNQEDDMRSVTPLSLLTAALIGFGACDGTTPATTAPSLDVTASVGARCYAVAGSLTEEFAGADFPNGVFFFQGPITGDLEGMSHAALTASDSPAGDPPGRGGFGQGERTIHVTGGSVPALAGLTLVFTVDQAAVANPPITRANDRMTLIAGARRGHVTVHGTFDFQTLTLGADYNGAICP